MNCARSESESYSGSDVWSDGETEGGRAGSKKLDDVGLSDSTVTDSGKRERKWETQKILSWSPEVTICKVRKAFRVSEGND